MQQPPYQCKCDAFETVDELRLLYGADMDTLLGEDANRNGILDPNENDDNQNGMLDPGVLEYFTVYSREPNTNSNGTARINIGSLSANGPASRAPADELRPRRAQAEILLNLGLVSTRRTRTVPAAGRRRQRGRPFASPARCSFIVKSGMTRDGVRAKSHESLPPPAGAYIEGRVNVNTASAAVLACLPG